jgi:hypothetical protein
MKDGLIALCEQELPTAVLTQEMRNVEVFTSSLIPHPSPSSVVE